MLTDQQISDMVATISLAFKSFRPTLLDMAGNITFDSKQDGSPVTKLDIEIENKLKSIVQMRWPKIGVGGEESGYSKGSDIFWLFDPIDGTKSFIEGKPSFTNMAVLIEKNVTIASIIYNPSTDKMYIAEKGRGMHINGNRILLEKIKPQSNIVLCKPLFIKEVKKLVEPFGFECVGYQSDGGNGLAWVSEGSVAARLQIHGNGSPHDYAPGAFLTVQAGGECISLENEPYSYKTTSFIACNKKFSRLVSQNLEYFIALTK